MKVLFTLLFSFGLSTLSLGQLEWTGNHEFSESCSELFRKSNGEIILVHGTDVSQDGNGFTVFDSMENIVFSKTFNDYSDAGGADVSDILELPDSSIVFSVSWGECDIIITEVLKYDKNWNEVWQNYAMASTGPAALLSDGNFVIGSNFFGIIERYSESGEQLWNKYLGDFHILDIAATANDTLLIASVEGLIRTDGDGEIDTVFSSLIFDRFEITGNGRFWAQHNDTISYLSPDFSTIGSIHIPDAAVVDFVFDENEIVILTDPPGVYRFDYPLQQIGSFALVGENQTFDHVGFYQEGFAIGGRKHWGSASHGSSSPFVKSYSAGGQTLDSEKDVGIENVSLSSPPVIFQEWSLYATFFQEVTVTVRNYGTTTLNRVNLNIAFPFVDISNWCPIDQRFSKAYFGLSLNPGETLELKWYNLKIFSHSPPPDIIPLCFWTSLPDHKLDANDANDVFCSDVMVANDEKTFSVNFQISPNPTATQATLGYQLPPGTTGAVHIFNSIGRQVEVFPVEQASGSLTLPEYPAGLYFVSLVVEGQVVRTERWVQF